MIIWKQTPKKQKDFIKKLETFSADEEVVWFDEFSLSSRTDNGFGWGIRNHTPKIASREKKKQKEYSFSCQSVRWDL